MDSSKDYYQYVEGYGNYERLRNEVDKDALDKHPIYRSIPYYNNEIKSLQDINKSYRASENADNIYYDENAKNSSSSDVNLIYNDGYPSYRMVNTASPRVVDLSQKAPASSISSDSPPTVASSRTEHCMASEISKLAEVIKELTSRLPLPPSPELLKSVHPNLAVKLQLTYLKAYIQNQQLLMDLKSNIEGTYCSSDPQKYSTNVAADTCDFNTGSNVNNYPIVEITSQYPQITNFQSSSSIGSEGQAGGDSTAFGGMHNLQIGNLNYPQLTNYPNFYYPLNTQPNYSLPQLPNYPQLTNYPQLADHPQLTNYPQLTDGSNYQYVNGNYDSGGYASGYKEEDEYAQYRDNPAFLVPAEYRDRVKYNSKKKAFYSVYLSSLGSRKRKSFSINKFGLAKALKLSIEFANQLLLGANKGAGVGGGGYSEEPQGEAQADSLALAVRERNLIQDVCEHALSVNRKTSEDFTLFEKALTMPRVRGLVYSLGSNLWMCIFYKNGKRRIQCYLVDEFGFEKAYESGLAFFSGNPQLVRSKLSGVLSYWLEPIPTMTLVIIFNIRPPNLGLAMLSSENGAREGEKEGGGTQKTAGKSSRVEAVNPDRLYIARFELEVHGSFLAAKRSSQGWLKCVKKYLSHLTGNSAHREASHAANSTDGSRGADPGSREGPHGSMGPFLDPDLLRLGFVYYDDHDKQWVVVEQGQSVRFSADLLGHLEAKKQAISLRQKHLISGSIAKS